VRPPRSKRDIDALYVGLDEGEDVAALLAALVGLVEGDSAVAGERAGDVGVVEADGAVTGERAGDVGVGRVGGRCGAPVGSRAGGHGGPGRGLVVDVSENPVPAVRDRALAPGGRR
jgi:hypothetical protein